MPAEARISPIWKKQKLFVALFMIAIGGWFFWDGFVGYPRSNERWEAHQRHLVEGRLADWPDYAKSRGWVPTPPHKLFKKSDIIGQYVFGGIGTLLGIIVLIYWATQKNQFVRTDENAVYTPRGTTVPFPAITGLGKKRWDAKGIAVVRYELDGRKGQFLLDDYKFDTEPTRKILDEIEAKLRARGEEPPPQN
jgi:hypothetical protein